MKHTTTAQSSRRNILKGLAAAAVAPTILPSRILGADGSTTPNEKIGLGIIGCGLITKGHRKGFIGKDQIQLRAVCDVKDAAANDFQKQANAEIAKKNGVESYSDVAAYANFDEMLERDDIDAIVVGTPDHWHAHATIAAMRAGKDVYCEKPLTLTVEEGKAIRDISAETGKVVQTGSQQRSDAYFRRACELIRNGYAGDITEVHVRLGSFPVAPEITEEPIPEGFDYDRWLGQAPMEPYADARVRGDYKGGWRSFWQYGARKNGDWGAHHYDITQWALGMDESGPVEFTPKGYEDAPFLQYKYANGITVYRDSDKCPEMINFHGSKGIVRTGRGSKLVTEPETIRTTKFTDSDVKLFESSDHRQNWIDCIVSREQPLCSASVGHRTATICHLAAIAERTGEIVKWNPETESLVDPSEAVNALYHRPRREGYELPA